MNKRGLLLISILLILVSSAYAPSQSSCSDRCTKQGYESGACGGSEMATSAWIDIGSPGCDNAQTCHCKISTPVSSPKLGGGEGIVDKVINLFTSQKYDVPSGKTGSMVCDELGGGVCREIECLKSQIIFNVWGDCGRSQDMENEPIDCNYPIPVQYTRVRASCSCTKENVCYNGMSYEKNSDCTLGKILDNCAAKDMKCSGGGCASCIDGFVIRDGSCVPCESLDGTWDAAAKKCNYCSLSIPSDEGKKIKKGTPTQASQVWVYDDTESSSCSWNCSSGYVLSPAETACVAASPPVCTPHCPTPNQVDCGTIGGGRDGCGSACNVIGTGCGSGTCQNGQCVVADSLSCASPPMEEYKRINTETNLPPTNPNQDWIYDGEEPYAACSWRCSSGYTHSGNICVCTSNCRDGTTCSSDSNCASSYCNPTTKRCQTVECIPTNEICNDGKDNDCDGQIDGEDALCIKMVSMSSPSQAFQGETFTVKCKSSSTTSQANCIGAKIKEDNVICGFNGWIDGEASFGCTFSSTSQPEITKTVECYISNKADGSCTIGTDNGNPGFETSSLTRLITITTTPCSSYNLQTDCTSNCKWCNSCDGKKTYTGASQCISSTSTCGYSCNKQGSCLAGCDANDGSSCDITDCTLKGDIECQDGTRKCADGTCKADCGGNELTCNSDGTCDATESCTCSDCYGRKDSCQEGSVCNAATEQCTSTTGCGNGVVDPGEQCDCGPNNYLCSDPELNGQSCQLQGRSNGQYLSCYLPSQGLQLACKFNLEACDNPSRSCWSQGNKVCTTSDGCDGEIACENGVLMGDCIKIDSTCQPPITQYQCIGSATNADLCSSDNLGLTADTTITFVSSCTDAKKCEFTCNSGYNLENGQCVQQTTIPCGTGPIPTTGCQCPEGTPKYSGYCCRNAQNDLVYQDIPCDQTPTSDFTVKFTYEIKGITATFTASNPLLNYFEWDFGDGNKQEGGQNLYTVSHTYIFDGSEKSFTVNLIAHNAEGKTAPASNVIKIEKSISDLPNTETCNVRGNSLALCHSSLDGCFLGSECESCRVVSECDDFSDDELACTGEIPGCDRYACDWDNVCLPKQVSEQDCQYLCMDLNQYPDYYFNGKKEYPQRCETGTCWECPTEGCKFTSPDGTTTITYIDGECVNGFKEVTIKNSGIAQDQTIIQPCSLSPVIPFFSLFNIILTLSILTVFYIFRKRF